MIKISSVSVILVISFLLTGWAQAPYPAGFALPTQIAPPSKGKQPSEVCGRVWPSNGGSFCNGVQLTAYQQADSRAISSEVADAGAKVTVVSANVKELARDQLNEKVRRRMLVNGNEFSGASAIVQDKELLAKLSPFEDPAKVTALKSQMATCLAFLKRARSAALCYICANQNAKYFRNGKAVVSQQDCGLMLNACEPFYQTAAELFASSNAFIVDAAKYITKSGAQTPPKSSSPNSNWQVNLHIKAIYGHMQKAGLPNLLNSYKSSTAPTEKAKVGNQICARTFRLHKDPLFSSIEAMSDELNTILPTGGRALSSSRNLDLLGPSEDPFIGDVVILQPADNMFVSYDGVQGSSQSIVEGFVPLNVTNIFSP